MSSESDPPSPSSGLIRKKKKSPKSQRKVHVPLSDVNHVPAKLQRVSFRAEIYYEGSDNPYIADYGDISPDVVRKMFKLLASEHPTRVRAQKSLRDVDVEGLCVTTPNDVENPPGHHIDFSGNDDCAIYIPSVFIAPQEDQKKHAVNTTVKPPEERKQIATISPSALKDHPDVPDRPIPKPRTKFFEPCLHLNKPEHLDEPHKKTIVAGNACAERKEDHKKDIVVPNSFAQLEEDHKKTIVAGNACAELKEEHKKDIVVPNSFDERKEDHKKDIVVPNSFDERKEVCTSPNPFIQLEEAGNKPAGNTRNPFKLFDDYEQKSNFISRLQEKTGIVPDNPFARRRDEEKKRAAVANAFPRQDDEKKGIVVANSGAKLSMEQQQKTKTVLDNIRNRIKPRPGATSSVTKEQAPIAPPRKHILKAESPESTMYTEDELDDN